METTIFNKDFNHTLSVIAAHSFFSKDFKYLSIEEFSKLKEETQKALFDYASSVNWNFKENDKSIKDKYLVVRNSCIILETSDHLLALDASGDNSCNGVVVKYENGTESYSGSKINKI